MQHTNVSELRSSVAVIPAVWNHATVAKADRPVADVVPFPANREAQERPCPVAEPWEAPVSNFALLHDLQAGAAQAEADWIAAHPIVRNGHGAASVSRAKLLSALSAIAKVVEKRNTIPILANVRLTGTPDGLRLVGTDLDIEAAQVIGGAAGQLDVTVPAHVLLDMVKRAKASEMVAIVYDGEAVALDFDGLKVKLTGFLPSSDFPELQATFVHRFELPAADLRTALAKTSVAMSTEETRYYLNGVYMHSVEWSRLGEARRELRFVATDGHRLVAYGLPGEGAAGIPGVIIPRKTVGEVLRAVKAKGAPDSVTVEIGGARHAPKMRFTVGDLVFTSKTVDGTYPDYQRVIPSGNEKRLTISVKTFASAIEQASVIQTDRGRAVKLDIADGSVTVSSQNPDTGTATVTIAAESYEGEPLQVGFNSGYLRDMLALIEGERVELRLGDPGSPALATDPTDDRFTFVQMPMRV